MLEVSTSYTKGPPYYHNWNYNKTIQIQTDCPIYCLIQSKLIANESLIILFILYILRDFLHYSDHHHTHPLILGMAVGDNGMMRDIFYPDESQPDLCFSPDYWWRMSRWLPTWWHSGSWRSPGWIKPKTSCFQTYKTLWIMTKGKQCQFATVNNNKYCTHCRTTSELL